MKRLITLILALAMIGASLVSCTSQNQDNDTTNPQDTTQAQDTTKAEDTTQAPEPAVKASVEEIANAVASSPVIQFVSMVTEVPVGTEYMAGFTKTIEGYSECYTFGPMIGSIPFAGYVFRVAEGTDVEEFKTQLKENNDMRWQICVSADTVVCESRGDIVLFVLLKVGTDEGAGLGTGADAALIEAFNSVE